MSVDRKRQGGGLRKYVGSALGVGVCCVALVVGLSPVGGLVLVPAGLAFGAFWVRRFRLVLHKHGSLLMFVAWALAPAVIADSLLSLMGTEVPRVLSAVATAGVVTALVWFAGLGVWPKLVVRGVRPQQAP